MPASEAKLLPGRREQRAQSELVLDRLRSCETRYSQAAQGFDDLSVPRYHTGPEAPALHRVVLRGFQPPSQPLRDRAPSVLRLQRMLYPQDHELTALQLLLRPGLPQRTSRPLEKYFLEALSCQL